MTGKLDSMLALHDAVKAGGDIPWGHADGPARKALGHLWAYGMETYLGSLDAAHALHKAVLPGWLMVEMSEGDKSSYLNNWVVVLGRKEDEGVGLTEANSDTPARAWLLAILTALKAKGDA